MQNNSEIRKKWFIEEVEKLKSEGTSYAEIAGKLDVLPQYLNGILNGDRAASEKMVGKLCKAFNITENSLFNRLKGYDRESVEKHTLSQPSGQERKLIPFYDDVTSMGGINGSVVDVSKSHVPTEWIDAGDWFPDATAAIRHYGDSMNEYPSGSILALKRVTDQRLLIWGRNYSIETSEFRITKQLQDGGDSYILGYSSNVETYPDGRQIHSPIRIPKETIRHIDQVIGCVTKEYSSGAMQIK